MVAKLAGYHMENAILRSIYSIYDTVCRFLFPNDITWKILCTLPTRSSERKLFCKGLPFVTRQEKKPNFIASVIQWRSSRITDPFGNIVSKLIYDISRLNIWTFPNNECNVYSKTYSWIIISRFCWQFVLSKCFF
jgi:hypothetical protein